MPPANLPAAISTAFRFPDASGIEVPYRLLGHQCHAQAEEVLGRGERHEGLQQERGSFRELCEDEVSVVEPNARFDGLIGRSSSEAMSPRSGTHTDGAATR